MRTYFGCVLNRSTTPGYALRWTAFTPKGQVAADTLSGLKELIRARCKPTTTSHP